MFGWGLGLGGRTIGEMKKPVQEAFEGTLRFTAEKHRIDRSNPAHLLKGFYEFANISL